MMMAKEKLIRFFLVMLALLPTTLLAETYRLTFLKAQERAVPNIRVGLTEAYKRIGHEVEFVTLPGRRALLKSNDGTYDGEAMRNANIQNKAPNLRAVKVPIAAAKMMVFGKPGTTYKKPEDISNLSMAAVLGIGVLEMIAKKYNVKTFNTNNLEKAFIMLDLDRVDVVVFTRSGGLKTIKALGLKNIDIIGPPVISIPIYHWVNKKNEHLIPQLELIIQDLVKEGVFPGM